MILVVATAIGLAVVRGYLAPGILQGHVTFSNAWSYFSTALTSVLVYWSTAILLIGLRPPRPRRHVLFRRPGMVACLALNFAVLTSSINSVWSLIGLHNMAELHQALYETILRASTSLHVLAPPVLLAWIILLVGGRWKSVPTWLDRVGRGIGFVLLALYAIVLARTWYLAIYR